MEYFLSSPDFHDYFETVFRLHSNLFFNQKLTGLQVSLQESHGPFKELQGLYQYILSLQESITHRKVEKLCFKASINGSMLGFNKWLTTQDDPFSDMILLDNLASKLGTAGYLLAANFCLKLISTESMQLAYRNQLRDIYENIFTFLIKAEMMQPYSGKYICNLYGKNFKSVLKSPENPLNNNNSITDYICELNERFQFDLLELRYEIRENFEQIGPYFTHKDNAKKINRETVVINLSELDTTRLQQLFCSLNNLNCDYKSKKIGKNSIFEKNASDDFIDKLEAPSMAC